MKSKLIEDTKEQIYALVLDAGEEVTATLERFAIENNLTGSYFTAIGAFSEVTLGFYDLQKQEYKRNELHEQVEVVSLVGNIASYKGKHKVHAHVVFAKSDGRAYGGHLLNARVNPTLEIVVTESPRALQRRYDEKTGLALLDFTSETMKKSA